MPWIFLRAVIADEWRMAPFEIPHYDDREDPLADEVARWIEVALLKQKYPMA